MALTWSVVIVGLLGWAPLGMWFYALFIARSRRDRERWAGFGFIALLAITLIVWLVDGGSADAR